MQGWKRSCSLLLLLSSSALAQVTCPAESAAEIQIGGQRFVVEVAATQAARERGLLRHAQLAPGAGMWFVLPEIGHGGFWMRGMRFPIDLIWIGPERRVVGAVTLPICWRAPCPIAYSDVPVAYVLETGAGGFAGRMGDTVEWRCSP